MSVQVVPLPMTCTYEHDSMSTRLFAIDMSRINAVKPSVSAYFASNQVLKSAPSELDNGNLRHFVIQDRQKRLTDFAHVPDFERPYRVKHGRRICWECRMIVGA